MATQAGRKTNGDCREDNCVLNEENSYSDVSGKIDTNQVPRKRRAPEPPTTQTSPGGDTRHSSDESKSPHADVELVSENRTLEVPFLEKKIILLAIEDYPEDMNPFGEGDGIDIIDANCIGTDVDDNIIDFDVGKRVKAIRYTDFDGRKGARGRSIEDYPEELNPFACADDDDNSGDTGVEE